MKERFTALMNMQYLASKMGMKIEDFNISSIVILSWNKDIIIQLAKRIEAKRIKSWPYRNVVYFGTNARLSEVQGAILRAQLSRLEQQVKKREENYEYLCEYLNSVDGIRMQTMNEDMTSNPHYMVMFYYDKTFFGNANRDEFVQYLRDSGVPCNRSYESIHRLPVIKTLDKEQWRMLANGQCKGEKCCVHSEKISKEVICLSHNILLGDKNLMYNIAKIICNFKEKTRLIIE